MDGSSIDTAGFTALRMRFDDDIAYLQIHRPEANNAINDRLIAEFGSALDACETRAKIVVVEGLPEVFCFGADFAELQKSFDSDGVPQQDPKPLYDIWRRLPPRQRKQLMALARKHGPTVAKRVMQMQRARRGRRL